MTDLKALAEEIMQSDLTAHDEMCPLKFDESEEGRETCGCRELLEAALRRVRSETIEECALTIDARAKGWHGENPLTEMAKEIRALLGGKEEKQ